MFMAVARSLFRNISAHVPEPNIIAKALNESMSEGNEMNMFVTMFVGVLDLQTGVLRYCNAGHDAPLLIGKDVSILPCDANLPIGVVDDWDYTVQETTIVPQTTIFLFTDGLNEAENVHHQQFGDEQVLSMAKELLENGESQPMPFVQRMAAAVRFFAGAAEQSDDLTMLAIQYKKEGE
jgi:sigma-B regulation protein RsbU (phosphoserine phosphatase)